MSFTLNSLIILIIYTSIELTVSHSRSSHERHVNVHKTSQTILEPVIQPIIHTQRVVTVNVPIETLLNDDKECPRLQNMGEKLLNDSQYCDVQIEVFDPIYNKSKLFCAHKSVLCMRSSVLAEKIKNLIDTGHGKPKIQLPNVKPEILKNILKFIYTDKFWPDFTLKDNILDLYLAASQLNITDLIDLTEDYLYSTLTMQEATDYLKWAQSHKMVKVKKIILDYARNTLSMSGSEWELFLKNVCESYGYKLIVGSTQPLNTDGDEIFPD